MTSFLQTLWPWPTAGQSPYPCRGWRWGGQTTENPTPVSAIPEQLSSEKGPHRPSVLSPLPAALLVTQVGYNKHQNKPENILMGNDRCGSHRVPLVVSAEFHEEC